MSMQVVDVHFFAGMGPGVIAKALQTMKVQPGNWFLASSECEGKKPWKVQVRSVEKGGSWICDDPVYEDDTIGIFFKGIKLSDFQPGDTLQKITW